MVCSLIFVEAFCQVKYCNENEKQENKQHNVIMRCVLSAAITEETVYWYHFSEPTSVPTLCRHMERKCTVPNHSHSHSSSSF